jgi:hypothetical protein
VIGTQDVGHDVPPGLLGGDVTASDHLGHHGMILGQLLQVTVAEEVGPAVPGVDDEQPPAAAEGHRQGRAHAG